jgi:hypothetical protein
MRTLLSAIVLFGALILVGKAVSDSARSTRSASANTSDTKHVIHAADRRAKQPPANDASWLPNALDWLNNPPLFGLLDDGRARLSPPPGWKEEDCPCCSGVEGRIRLAQFEEPVEPGASDADTPSDDGMADNEPVEDIRPASEAISGLKPIQDVPLGEIPDAPRVAKRNDARSTKLENPNAEPGQEQAPGDESAAREPEKLELSPQMQALRTQVRDCLSHYYFRNENVANRSPWGIMHTFIPYGVDSQVIVNGKRMNAAGWLCYNGTCRGQQLLYAKNGKLNARIGVGVQGHAGQFLAMLAQSRVPKNYPLRVDGLNFTVADLVDYEKRTCKAGTELTFKLIALAVYLKSDETWHNEQGEPWSIPRLIQEELKQPIVGAACGGTHRLTGFSYAVHMREQRGEPIDGQWSRAERFLQAYRQYVFRLQNPDGSFSTDWFKGRADTGVTTRRLETTGHMTEWLVHTLPDEQLQDPRVIRAVGYLSNMLLENRNEKWSIGPLGHGLHALALYDERVFGGTPGQRAAELAEHARTSKLR